MPKRNNDNVIFWIVGIILFIIIAYNAPGFKFPFSILTTTTCIDNTISDWEFNGNVLDEKGLNNGVNFGGTFSSGTINLNGSTYINLPLVSGDVIEILKYSTDTNFYFLSKINGVNYVNGVADNSKLVIPLGNNMGLGTNVTIDRIAVFSNLTLQTMQSLYNNGTSGNICWTTSQEVNISCSDYAISQIPDNSSGSLSYSSGFYPNCTFVWKEAQYKITNNLCSRSFLYQDSCISSNNCYSTNQLCVQNLKYSCFVLSNNACTEKTDYTSCVLNTTYTTLSGCQANVQVSTTTTTTTASVIPPEEKIGIQGLATKEIFNIFGISITALHLLIVLILIIGILYFTGAFGGKK